MLVKYQVSPDIDVSVAGIRTIGTLSASGYSFASKPVTAGGTVESDDTAAVIFAALRCWLSSAACVFISSSLFSISCQYVVL